MGFSQRARHQTPSRHVAFYKCVALASELLSRSTEEKKSINSSKSSAVEFSRRFNFVLVGSKEQVEKLKVKSVPGAAVERNKTKSVQKMFKVGWKVLDQLHF